MSRPNSRSTEREAKASEGEKGSTLEDLEKGSESHSPEKQSQEEREAKSPEGEKGSSLEDLGKQGSESHSPEKKSQEKQGEDGGNESSENEPNNDELAMSGTPLYMFSAAMMIIVFLMNLDHYILAVAIPRITTDFQSLADAAWYSSGYYLTNMAFQPAFGQLYKFFSIKYIYMLSLVIFEIGSIICAVAPNSAALIIGRLITGVGGGGLYIGSVVLIGFAVPGRHRAMYISIVTSLDGVASAVGPPLGGVFTESARLTWRFCFWINLPLGFVVLVLLIIYLHDPAIVSQDRNQPILKKVKSLDWVGLMLLLAGFTLLLLSLQWAGMVYPWSDPRVYACLAAGCLILAAYLGQQFLLGESAAIPYRVLRQRTVFSSAIFILFINVLIGALVYYLPFQFQAVRNQGPEAAGITHLAFLVPLMLSPLVSGGLISLFGYYVPFMYLGSTLASIGSGFLTTLSQSTPFPRVYGYQFLAGFGSGLCHQIPYTSILHVIAAADVVSGSALCSFLNSLGAILGIVGSQAIFASLLLGRLYQHEADFLNQGTEGATLDSKAIVRAGPSRIEEVVPTALVGLVRDAYSEALQKTYLLPVAAAGLCFIASLGMEWRRQKKM